MQTENEKFPKSSQDAATSANPKFYSAVKTEPTQSPSSATVPSKRAAPATPAPIRKGVPPAPIAPAPLQASVVPATSTYAPVLTELNSHQLSTHEEKPKITIWAEGNMFLVTPSCVYKVQPMVLVASSWIWHGRLITMNLSPGSRVAIESKFGTRSGWTPLLKWIHHSLDRSQHVKLKANAVQAALKIAEKFLMLPTAWNLFQDWLDNRPHLQSFATPGLESESKELSLPLNQDSAACLEIAWKLGDRSSFVAAVKTAIMFSSLDANGCIVMDLDSSYQHSIPFQDVNFRSDVSMQLTKPLITYLTSTRARVLHALFQIFQDFHAKYDQNCRSGSAIQFAKCSKELSASWWDLSVRLGLDNPGAGATKHESSAISAKPVALLVRWLCSHKFRFGRENVHRKCEAYAVEFRKAIVGVFRDDSLFDDGDLGGFQEKKPPFKTDDTFSIDDPIKHGVREFELEL